MITTLNADRHLDMSESRELNVSELPDFISRQVFEAQRYYFDFAGPRTAKLHVAFGGMERVQPDYVVDRKKFLHFSIEFVTKGKGRIDVAGKSYSLVPGTVFGYSPATPCKILSDPSEPLTKYQVAFSGRAAESILQTARLAPWGIAQVYSLSKVRDIFEMLQINGLAHSRFSQHLCGLLVQLLAGTIAEQSLPHNATYTKALFTYIKLREAMNEHFMDFINIEDVAAFCHISPHYISRLFKRFDHVTPYHYLLRLRMEHAANLFCQPGAIIKHVASQLGFSDQFQFSRAFKRIFGVAPSEFQRQHTVCRN